MHITLIEDNKYLADNIIESLQSEGNEVTSYRRAIEVESNINSIDADSVIVLDLIMRRGSEVPDYYTTGEHLYEQLKELYPDVKIIIVTAMDDTELVSKKLIKDIKDKKTPFIRKSMRTDFRELKEELGLVDKIEMY